MTRVWERACIVGTGLLGTSVGLAMRKHGLVKTILGFDKDPSQLAVALCKQAVDRVAATFEEAADGADLVVIGTPVSTIAENLIRASRIADQDALFIDVGSTKASLIARIEGEAFASRFVGCHPMSGSEKSGAEHGNADLFHRQVVLMSPTSVTVPQSIEQARQLWLAMGAQVVSMGAVEHDEMMAQVSHLPHLLASALAASTPAECLEFTGLGWADATRIASGNVALWEQIVHENRQPLLQAMQNFATIWQTWIDAVQSGHPDELIPLLELGKKSRDVVADRHSSR